VEQILAEHYPQAYPPSDTEASHSQVSSAQPYRQPSSVSTPNGIRRNNTPIVTNGNTDQPKTNGTEHKNVPFIDGKRKTLFASNFHILDTKSETDKQSDPKIIENVHAVFDYNGGK
jgi:hypothetical protein